MTETLYEQLTRHEAGKYQQNAMIDRGALTMPDWFSWQFCQEADRWPVYLDSEGYETYGIGHLVTDEDRKNEGSMIHGFSDEHVMRTFVHDVGTAEHELRRSGLPLPSDRIRYEALVNMCFNLGITRLRGFKKMWAAIGTAEKSRATLPYASEEEGWDWDMVHDEALDSKWARQVGGRAIELARQLQTGERK